jgi:hypothetical protein
MHEFDQIIIDTLGYKKIAVSGNYKIQKNSFKLEIDESDIEQYLKLFYKSPNKGVGNGEVSIYWLFNYSKEKRAYENRGGSNADLTIDGYNCEVKSYPSHNMKIVLGKFKEDVFTRNIINTLFGLSNLCSEYVPGNSTLSEIQFSYDDVFNSFLTLGYFKDFFISNKNLIAEHRPLTMIKNGIVDLYKQLMIIDKDIGKKSIEDVAAVLMLHLVKTKFDKKPGSGGFMINCLKTNPLDVEFNYVNLENIYNIQTDKVKNNVNVGSGEIKVNYNLFS